MAMCSPSQTGHSPSALTFWGPKGVSSSNATEWQQTSHSKYTIMKELKNPFRLVRTVTLMFWLLGPVLLIADATVGNSTTNPDEVTEEVVAKNIFLTLLLDTSNSMDGLIDQAKSQLWNIVDELADAEQDGQPADLHIALYEYGNDNLSVRSNYIRQLSGFTQDLDTISTLLFSLQTNGGSEYCGAVIGTSLDDLAWGDASDDLRMVFIAGNEPFDQGGISYEGVCRNAASRDIQINTIFCGDYREGIDTHWAKGASIGGGSYMNIDMDQKTVYVPTPYDARIDQLNDELNDTYVAYGAKGRTKKESQLQEDSNAASYSQSNKVKRAISKSKRVYKNESWDLVDASRQSDFDLDAIEEENLPEEMKPMTTQQRETYISEKSVERKRLQEEIQQFAAQRELYIKQVNDSLNVKNELEEAILNSVKETARQKSFTFKEQ